MIESAKMRRQNYVAAEDVNKLSDIVLYASAKVYARYIYVY